MYVPTVVNPRIPRQEMARSRLPQLLEEEAIRKTGTGTTRRDSGGVQSVGTPAPTLIHVRVSDFYVYSETMSSGKTNNKLPTIVLKTLFKKA